MSYVMVGNKIIDSEEVLNKIKDQLDYKKVNDLTKGAKRDDTLVYQILQDTEKLKEDILEEIGDIHLSEEELIDELMTLADEKVLLIEELIPEGFITYTYSYQYDEGLEEIKTIFVAIDEQVGELRLRDVAERILKSID